MFVWHALPRSAARIFQPLPTYVLVKNHCPARSMFTCSPFVPFWLFLASLPGYNAKPLLFVNCLYQVRTAVQPVRILYRSIDYPVCLRDVSLLNGAQFFQGCLNSPGLCRQICLNLWLCLVRYAVVRPQRTAELHRVSFFWSYGQKTPFG